VGREGVENGLMEMLIEKLESDEKIDFWKDK